MNNKQKVKLILVITLILIIILAPVAYYLNISNDIKKWKIFSGLKLEYQNINEEYVEYGLDLDYIANEDDLSNDNDNINLIQLVKDQLYLFNLDVMNYDGKCSIYYTESCTFEVYRAYLSEYENTDGINDHNSGYDVDLKLPYISRGSLKGHTTGDYILENAKYYGFISRYLYEEDRADQYSHFRYVGADNSILMNLLDLSMEDYIEDFKLNYVYYIEETNKYMYKTEIKNNQIKLPKEYVYYTIYMINDSMAIISVEI